MVNNNNYHSCGVPEFMAYGGIPVGIPKGAVPQHATGGAVPQWALKPKNTQSAQSNAQQNSPNCYIEFDGRNVDLYKYGQDNGLRLQNGQLQYNLNGQSGGDDYQNRVSQSIPNKGPIPEGTYYANQDQRQNIDFINAGIGTFYPIAQALGFRGGAWKGGPAAWGLRRVWLKPDVNTNTYGRNGFSIHGGWNKGSAGCIDIPWQTKQFSNFMDGCQDSVSVYVKYPKENW